ncbi:DUF4238 domain-containing protein [Vibrio cholerae]|uniref:DUF4238 domain-containing protein n=1 Tax=Vibrio cholerae TaxID=666 RepID=UPI00163D2A65|nr:DUF4238 domain-containing protein [Vibrio cholerae]
MKSSNRNIIHGEKHHWWPKSLSKHWVNDQGSVHRIDCYGKIIKSNPKQFGLISDGHNILFRNGSVWNSTIEGHFDRPDNAMPQIVDMLKNLRSKDDGERFIDVEKDTDELNLLRECLLSLLVRAPLYRFYIESMLSGFRGQIGKQETKRLISLNMNQKYDSLIKSSRNSGRLVVLFSDENEFIYGDGIYSTLSSTTEKLTSFKAVVPITPKIAVIWSIPTVYTPYPKLSAKLIDNKVVSVVNDATQIYSKEYLFYCNQQPALSNDFKCNEHQMYEYHDGPITDLIRELVPEKKFFW